MAIEERGAPRESRLEALIWRARFALFWESAWPWLAAALAVVVLFLTVSWLGLWDAPGNPYAEIDRQLARLRAGGTPV
ncbi:DUF4175 family protein, partial [Hansschlegelia beijingensis]|uniref:DUF4175 family protein n=1 Tax=Hansschlegelia beijingensis TaxID=1133344 RepID=UPI00387F220D